MNTIMKQNLSKLKKVNLRDVWGHEALGFTRWLSEEENLSLLSDELGVDIKLIQTEAGVGRFNVDILGEESNSGHKIIIENQLEDTNHDHLGKIITYAAGYDAKIIVWIVKDYREEHQKAIDWLNEHTDETIGFFLIKIELWQIGDSKPAPKFVIIANPNEWAKTIKTNANNGELTDTKLQQLDFWTKLKSYIHEKNSRIKLQTPRPQHWYDFSIGDSNSHIALTLNSRDNSLACEIYISHNKDLFFFLKDKSDLIEKEIGDKPEWIDANVASRIKIKKEVSDVFDSNQAENYFNWFYEKIILFQKVFTKQISIFKRQ